MTKEINTMVKHQVLSDVLQAGANTALPITGLRKPKSF